MSQHLAKRVLNTGLRGVTLVLKFVLLFSLARFLEPGDVGLYGLVFATVTYTQHALGLDFYAYANRELIAADPHTWTVFLRDQGILYLIAYAAILPFSLLLFFFDILPWNIIFWFFILLILEHLAHELARILIAMSQQMLATVLLFMRAGAWVLILVPAMWLEPRVRTLEWVLFSWGIGTSLACVLGFGKILSVGHWNLRRPVNWTWLGRGVRVAIPLLVATLAVKGISTFDRYWMENIGGLEVLAAYVLFVGIANAVKTFLESGVFVFVYPGLIRAARRGDEPAFRKGMRALAWQTFAVTICLAAAALLLIHPLLHWIDRPIYDEYVMLLYWTIGAVSLYAAGMVFHYGIYAHSKDGPIVRSHVAGLLVFLLSVGVLHRMLGVVAVPMGTCLAYGLIVVWKSIAFRRIRFVACDAQSAEPFATNSQRRTAW